MSFGALPSPQRGQVEEIVRKWEGFLGKLGARVDSVLSEANAGLDLLITQHPLAAKPMGQALSAVQVRFNGLDRKLDQAWEKIEAQLEEIADDSSLGGSAVAALEAAQERMATQQAELSARLTGAHDQLQMEKQAAWARQLAAIATSERVEQVACVQCGGSVPIRVYWRAVSETCPYCQAVNEITPGTAASLFYAGTGVHALAQEAAWPLWQAAQAAESRHHGFRSPSSGDRAAVLEAHRIYWRAYYGRVAQLNPAFDGDIEGAVAAKMKHWERWG